MDREIQMSSAIFLSISYFKSSIYLQFPVPPEVSEKNILLPLNWTIRHLGYFILDYRIHLPFLQASILMK